MSKDDAKSIVQLGKLAQTAEAKVGCAALLKWRPERSFLVVFSPKSVSLQAKRWGSRGEATVEGNLGKELPTLPPTVARSGQSPKESLTVDADAIFERKMEEERRCKMKSSINT